MDTNMSQLFLFKQAIYCQIKSKIINNVTKDIVCTGIQCVYNDYEETLYYILYDVKSWDITKDGKVCNNPLFLRSLKKNLAKLGLCSHVLQYAEEIFEESGRVALYDFGELYNSLNGYKI